jgi:hypothetical protein
MASRSLITAVLMLLAGTAQAQVSAPPTKAPDPTPEYVPPPPMPTPAPGGGNAGSGKPTPPPQPNLPIEPPLRDKDGKVIQINRPLFWQAMDHNTAVTASVKENAKPFFERRLRKYEKIVSDNADLMRQVNEGVIDKSDLVPNRNQGRQAIQQAGAGKVSLSALMQILKPLVGDNCREEMQKAGVITRIQATQNVKVMQAYNAELAADFEKSLPKLPENADDKAKNERKEALNREKQRQLMYQWIDEATFAYRGLLETAGEKPDEFLSKAGVDAKTVEAELKAVKDAKDAGARIDAMKKLMLKLPVEQERAVLEAVRATRPAAPDAPEASSGESGK